MGLFGFFKKGKKESKKGFSSRRRRIISSADMSAAKQESKPRAETAAASTPLEEKPPAAAEETGETEKTEVGRLRRGEASDLTSSLETESSDTALRDFINKMRLGDPLKVEDAFSRKSSEKPFIEILVEEHIIDENSLLVELSKKCMIPQGKLRKYKIRKKALECVDSSMAKQLLVLPVDKLGQILSVAMVNPLNTDALKTIGTMTGLRVKSVVCSFSEFKEQFEKHYLGMGEVVGSEESLDIAVDEVEVISPEAFKQSLREAEEAQKKKEPEEQQEQEEEEEVVEAVEVAEEIEEAAVVEEDTIEATKATDEALEKVAEETLKDMGTEFIETMEEVVESAVEEAIEETVAAAIEEVIEEARETAAEEEGPEVIALEEIPSEGGTGEAVDLKVLEPVQEEEYLIEPIIEGIDLYDDGEETKIIEPIIIPAAALTHEENVEEGEYSDGIKVVEEEFRQGITLGAMDLFKKWESLHRKKRIITLNMVPEEVFGLVVFES